MREIDLNLEMGGIMMNKLGEEENKRKILRKHKENQRNQESIELKKLRQEGVQEIAWQLFNSSKGQERIKVTKRPFDVITGDGTGYLGCARQCAELHFGDLQQPYEESLIMSHTLQRCKQGQREVK